MSEQPTEPESSAASAADSERPDPAKLSAAERDQMLRDGLGLEVSSRLDAVTKNLLFSDERLYAELHENSKNGLGAVRDAEPRLANQLLENFNITARVGETAEQPAEQARRTPGVPQNARNLEQLRQQAQAEAQMSPQELMGFLKAKLDESRDVVAALGAKRGTRLFNRSKKFNMAHAHHMGIIRKLTGVRLNNEEAYQGMTAAQKVAAGHMMIAEEYGKLKTLGEEKMNGTKMGKLINWMNKGGRFKRFLKYAMVGGIGAVAGVGVGVVTGGVGLAGTAAGAALGLGAGAGIRGVRGFFVGEGKYGRNLDMDATQAGMAPEDFLRAEGREEEIIDRSTMAMGELFNGAVRERRRRLRRSIGRGALYASFGVGAGYALSATGAYGSAREMIGESRIGHSEWGQKLGLGPVDNTDGAGMNPEDVNGNQGDGAGMNPDDIPETGRFHYDANNNPFYDAGKESTHAMGPALEVNPAVDKGTPGLNALTQERWVHSPEQLASVYNAMGLHDVPNNMLEVDKLAETFRIHESDMSAAYDKVMAVVNADTTHFRIEPISGAYESEWMSDPNFESTGMMNPASNPQIYWDDYVAPHGGSVIVMDYVNPTSGAQETMMFRTDCGGQRIVPRPEPVYVAPVSSVSYAQPSYVEQPVYYEESPPPPEYPPEAPPPEYPPEAPPPPVPPIPPIPPIPPVPPIPPIVPPVEFPKLEINNPGHFGPEPHRGLAPPALPTPRGVAPPVEIRLPRLGGNSGGLAPGAGIPRNLNLGPQQGGISLPGGNRGLF